MDRTEQEAALQAWKEKTGQEIFLQSEDGRILASTCSLGKLFFREAVSGRWKPAEIASRTGPMGVALGQSWCLVLLESEGLTASLLEEIAAAVLGRRLVPESCVGDGKGQLFFLEEGDPLEEMADLAEMVRGSLEVETLSRVRMGISACHAGPEELPEAWQEAETALESLKCFPESGKTAVYERLGLKLAAMKLGPEEARQYLGSFPGEPALLFTDPDLVHTAVVFLETGLNSAETARRLVVHRNTLNYRLDKIERISGLDLKKFPDAAAFYYALLLWQAGKAER